MLRYIESIEQKCFNPGFAAPAERLDDFIAHKCSSSFPETSFPRPLVPVVMDDVLPPLIAESLREGFKAFDRMTRSRFITGDALIIAPETRTSSPVRILRDAAMKQGRGYFKGCCNETGKGTLSCWRRRWVCRRNCLCSN